MHRGLALGLLFQAIAFGAGIAADLEIPAALSQERTLGVTLVTTSTDYLDVCVANAACFYYGGQFFVFGGGTPTEGGSFLGGGTGGMGGGSTGGSSGGFLIDFGNSGTGGSAGGTADGGTTTSYGGSFTLSFGSGGLVSGGTGGTNGATGGTSGGTGGTSGTGGTGGTGGGSVPAPVPEPATLIAVALGLMGIRAARGQSR